MSASVSESIGKLLLEGYKMLADSCEVCFTVLMQDRRGRIICVKCESDSMANAGQEDRMTPTSKMSNGGSNANTVVTGNQTSNSAIATTVPITDAFTSVKEALTMEMKDSAVKLQDFSKFGDNTQQKLLLVQYIRECAETLQSLQVLK